MADVVDLDVLDRLSMACPALPLCGLAITEAERSLPDVNKRVRALINKLGLEDLDVTMRMTGCPNGCARPYMAEIGFVGDGPNTYQVRGFGVSQPGGFGMVLLAVKLLTSHPVNQSINQNARPAMPMAKQT